MSGYFVVLYNLLHDQVWKIHVTSLMKLGLKIYPHMQIINVRNSFDNDQ